MSLKKLLIIVFLSVCLLITGIGYYYFTHPEAAASLAERAISRITGVSVHIRHLSYSIRPLQVAARQIAVTPASGGTGFSLNIPKLDARMSLEGAFGSRRLVIDTLRVTGFSVAYRQADFAPIPKEEPTVSAAKSVIMRLVAFLFFKDIRIDDVMLNGGEAAVDLNSRVLTVKKISAFRSADKGIEFGADALFRWPSKKATIRIPELHLSLKDVLSLSDPVLKGQITANRIHLEHPETTLSNLDLRLEGDLDISKQQMTAPEFTVSTGDGLHLAGTLEARGGSRPDAGLSLSVSNGYFWPETLLPLLPERFKSTLPPLSVTGKVSTDGTVAIMKEPAGWVWNGDVNFRFSQNPFSYVTGKYGFRGRVTGSLNVGGDIAETTLSGDLTLKQALFSDPNFSLDLSEAGISLTGKHPVYRIKTASAKISRIIGTAPLKGIPMEDIRIRIADGGVDLAQPSCSLSGIRLQSPLIQNVSATVAADAKTVRVQIQGEKTGLLEALRTLKLLPDDWQLGADDAVSIDAIFTPPDRLLLNTRIGLERLRIQDPDSRLMGENVGMGVRFSGEVDLSDLSLSGTIGCKTHGGEVLYDLFYLDLKSNPFRSSGQVVYTPSARSLEFKNLNLTLDNTLSLEITGGLRLQKPPAVNCSLKLLPAPVHPLFNLFVKDPFESKKPYLSTIEPGGRVSTHLELANTAANWSVKGRLQWRDGSFSVKGTQLRLGDIQMDVPVWYHGGTGHTDETPLDGTVTIGRVNFPPMPEQRIFFQVNATPGRLTIPTPTMIRIPGGSARLGPVAIQDLFSRGISAKTDLQVDPTDISPLLLSVWPQMPKSLLSGTLDPVIVAADRIETRGQLAWEVFGGRIVYSKLGVDRWLSSGPLIRATAELDGLNLGQITDGTAFGRIDGVLTGWVKDLEIVYGQPQGFDLFLETQKTQGVPQKISIKAVDNIARIGGGQSPFMGLAGVFTNLFETLNYEKIGVRASLENDLFRINGTVLDQGREYLMKGSLFAGVNIINQNPDNRIRFKDMVKRIQRATSGGGKPVIR